MVEESFHLNEVVINQKRNPALAIIKNIDCRNDKILKRLIGSMQTFIPEEFLN
jgi:hypothetical protein